MPEMLERLLGRARPPAPDDAPPGQAALAALDALPGGLAVFDATQRLGYCSTGFAALLGLPPGSLHEGLRFPALVDLLRTRATPGAEPTGLLMMDGAAPEAPRRFERLMPGGRRVAFTAVRLEDGSLALSGQDALPAAPRHPPPPPPDLAGLHQAQARVRELEDAAGRFISNLGHELRTPLNAIAGMLQVVQGDPAAAGTGEYLRKAQDAARSLQDIVSQVLDCAEAQEGRAALQPAPFSLDALLRELSVVLSHAAGDRPVAVAFDIDPDVPDRLLGDARRIGQVLRHLGSNALKFTAGGHAVLRVSREAAPAGRATLAFAFEDTGQGMDAPTLARVRGGLGQADASSTRVFGGMGLGLATSRQLLALMDSALEIHSDAGRGSRVGFRLTLPVESETPGTPERGAQATAPRVLVADHHPVRREALARMVRTLGWNPVQAAGVEEALEVAIQTPRLHAALVEWRLDGSGDFEAALRLSEILVPTGTPVLVTGNVPGGQAWGTLDTASRQRLPALLVQPTTAGLLAEGVAQARQQAGPPPARPTPIGRPLAGLRLLLAEDNVNNQLVASRLLTAQGATVSVAVDGLDALTHLVAGGEFDAILMDWQMPNMDGLETTREIRQICGFSHLPVIALTANGSAADRAACLAAGMDAHLAKPIDVALLVRTVLEVTRPAAAPAAAPAPALPPVEADARLPAALRDLLEAPAGHAGGEEVSHVPEPMLDRAAAMARLGCDPDFYDALVDLFTQDTPQLHANLADAAREGRREVVVREAHSLKGSAGTLGAMHLASSAASVEQAFARPPGAQDGTTLARLEEAVRLTLLALAPAGPAPA